MREARSPSDRRHAILYSYPDEHAGLPRIRGCPREKPYGCPIRGTAPDDPRVSLFLSYHAYWRRGFSWEQWRREPLSVVAAIETIEAARAEVSRRSLQDSKAKSEEARKKAESTGRSHGPR